jgi:hypothetical protein
MGSLVFDGKVLLLQEMTIVKGTELLSKAKAQALVRRFRPKYAASKKRREEFEILSVVVQLLMW